MLRKYICCIAKDPDDTSRVIRKRIGHPWKIYSLQELQQATNNFSKNNKIGEGGFGTVYLGRTRKGEEIAIKRLKAMSTRSEKEFVMEVEILARVRHKNLLSLRGFYSGGKERLIVYDYIPNHSLIDHLHGNRAYEMLLDWPRRIKIAIGIAEGIAYLHHEASPHIIHRDIKGSNVLLDANLEAKVADFGFAKLVPHGASHVTTGVKGTLGYLAPEYAMLGKVSERSDVYSFGVLLLQLISGHKAVERLQGGLARGIVEWALPLVERGQWGRIADLKLDGEFDMTQFKMLVKLATQCANNDAVNRPSMLEVVEILKNIAKSHRRIKVVKHKEIGNYEVHKVRKKM